MIGRLLKLAVVGLLIGASFLIHLELTVGGEFEVFPIHNADVRAEVDGLIEEIHVQEGDSVAEDQIVAVLSGRKHRADFDKTDAQLRERRAELRELKAGSRAEEVELAEDEVSTARTKVELAQARYDEGLELRKERLAKARAGIVKAEHHLSLAVSEKNRLEELRKKNIVSEQRFEAAEWQVAVRRAELDSARSELNLIKADTLAELAEAAGVARNQLREAEARLALVRAGPRPEKLEAVTASIERLTAERDYLATHLDLINVRSPIRGMVTTPKVEEKLGQYVKKGDLIMEVYDLSTIAAEIHVSEKDIGDVRPGQQVLLKARSYPGRDFDGVVRSIAPVAIDEDGGLRRKIVRVITEFENEDLALKPGMTGHGKISCGSRRVSDLITRRLFSYVRVEFWSWW